MFGTLDEVDDISGNIFACDEPGVAGAADAHAFALSDGVVGNAVVSTEDFAIEGFEVTWGVGNVFAKKFFEVAFADEAEAGAVFFLVGGEVVFFGDGAEVFFEHVADGKKNFGQDVVFDGVEEVGLVFAGIGSFEQFEVGADAAVVAGGEVIGAEFHGFF